MMLAHFQDLVLVIMQILVFHAADNLLDHVGHGNNAGRAAVFVNHHGDLRVLSLQHLQKLRDGNAFRHRLNRANLQVFHRGALGQQIGILNVHEAHDVVLVLAEHGVTREFVLPHEIEIRFKIIVVVDSQHLGARRHDSLRVLIVQVENIIQILVLILLDRSALGAFFKQQLNFFLGISLGFILGIVAGQAHNAIGGSVKQPHDGISNAIERMKRTRCVQRVGFRLQNSHALRDELAGHHMQRGHDEVANTHRNNGDSRVGQAKEHEDRVKQRGKRGLAQPAQRQRSQRNTQLTSRKVLVNVVGHFERTLGALLAFFH